MTTVAAVWCLNRIIKGSARSRLTFGRTRSLFRQARMRAQVLKSRTPIKSTRTTPTSRQSHQKESLYVCLSLQTFGRKLFSKNLDRGCSSHLIANRSSKTKWCLPVRGNPVHENKWRSLITKRLLAMSNSYRSQFWSPQTDRRFWWIRSLRHASTLGW